MRQIKFSGHSDDVVCLDFLEEGASETKHDESYEMEFLVGDKNGRARIRATYDGTWSFAVSQYDEGVDLPDATFEVGVEHSYSMNLTIKGEGLTLSEVK